MSSLRELLNPEKPETCLQGTETNGSLNGLASTSTVGIVSSPNANDGEDIFFQENLYNTPRKPQPNTSLVEDTGHPPHENCPDSLDCLPDTNGKPQHTLPVILRCAILGSAKRKLTIRDIYSAMEKKYPYYRTAGPAWKQSVRHHLSLSRLFERKSKPVTEPGFGSYWTVNLDAPPGTKRPRKRGRQTKAIGSSNQSSSSNKIDTPPSSKGKSVQNMIGLEHLERDQAPSLASKGLGHARCYDHNSLEISPEAIMTRHPPTTTRLSRQFRLYSVHDRASPAVEVYDDDEMLDIHDRGFDHHSSAALSDDGEGSIDGHSERLALESCSGDPRLLGPPSFAAFPVDPKLITSYNDPIKDIKHLKEEINELRRRTIFLTTSKKDLETDLELARAEIVRLRERNDLLERERESGRSYSQNSLCH